MSPMFTTFWLVDLIDVAEAPIPDLRNAEGLITGWHAEYRGGRKQFVQQCATIRGVAGDHSVRDDSGGIGL